MRFLSRRATRFSSAHGVTAVALLCAMIPLQAVGEGLEARPSGVETPLSDEAFSTRTGAAMAAPRTSAKAALVPVRAVVGNRQRWREGSARPAGGNA